MNYDMTNGEKYYTITSNELHKIARYLFNKDGEYITKHNRSLFWLILEAYWEENKMQNIGDKALEIGENKFTFKLDTIDDIKFALYLLQCGFEHDNANIIFDINYLQNNDVYEVISEVIQSLDNDYYYNNNIGINVYANWEVIYLKEYLNIIAKYKDDYINNIEEKIKDLNPEEKIKFIFEYVVKSRKYKKDINDYNNGKVLSRDLLSKNELVCVGFVKIFNEFMRLAGFKVAEYGYTNKKDPEGHTVSLVNIDYDEKIKGIYVFDPTLGCSSGGKEGLFLDIHYLREKEPLIDYYHLKYILKKEHENLDCLFSDYREKFKQKINNPDELKEVYAEFDEFANELIHLSYMLYARSDIQILEDKNKELDDVKNFFQLVLKHDMVKAKGTNANKENEKAHELQLEDQKKRMKKYM